MNGCRFSRYNIGDFVDLVTQDGECACGQSLPIEVKGTYRGHITDSEVYDVVLLDRPFRCPGCGDLKYRYLNRCNAGDEWIFTNAYSELESGLD